MVYAEILKLASVYDKLANINIGDTVQIGSKKGTVIGFNDTGCFPDGSVIVDVDGKQEYLDPEELQKKASHPDGDLYRKRPVEVHAYQTDKEMDIDTLEGKMHASKGDWIVTGTKGEKYPVKPDIFEETYEPVR